MLLSGRFFAALLLRSSPSGALKPFTRYVGWLPDILPESAVDIRTSNNLDLNYSVGEFSFAPAESSKLFGRLSAGAPASSPFESWQETVADYKEDGYSSWSYSDESGTWAFFCRERKGQCDYLFWLSR